MMEEILISNTFRSQVIKMAPLSPKTNGRREEEGRKGEREGEVDKRERKTMNDSCDNKPVIQTYTQWKPKWQP